MLLILVIAYLFIHWVRVETINSLFAVGLVWFILTLVFEMSLGRFVLGLSWERIAVDYDFGHGGLLSFGMLVLALSPLIASGLRRLKDGK